MKEAGYILDVTNREGELRGLTRNRILDPAALIINPLEALLPFGRISLIECRPKQVTYHGPRVYYINGVDTSRSKARDTGMLIAEKLGAVVYVYNNKSDGIVYDSLEAGLNIVDVPAGVSKQLIDIVSSHRQQINIISHSQGGEQIHSILKWRRHRGLSNDHVAWVLMGVPNTKYSRLGTGKRRFHHHGSDIVSGLLGRNSGDLSFADHAVENYIPLLDTADLWETE